SGPEHRPATKTIGQQAAHQRSSDTGPEKHRQGSVPFGGTLAPPAHEVERQERVQTEEYDRAADGGPAQGHKPPPVIPHAVRRLSWSMTDRRSGRSTGELSQEYGDKSSRQQEDQDSLDPPPDDESGRQHRGQGEPDPAAHGKPAHSSRSSV